MLLSATMVCRRARTSTERPHRLLRRDIAVREWRYDPIIVEGKAVPARMTVTVNFSRK